MVNAFGRNYEELGSSDKGLILKNSGKVKILWGKSYIDLLDTNGKLNVKVDTLIKSVPTNKNVTDDGFYYVEDTRTLMARVGDSILSVASEDGMYISFVEELELESNKKYTALKNIGFIYPNINSVTEYPTNGIIYNEVDEQLYIVKDKILTGKYQPGIPSNIDTLLTLHKPVIINVEDLDSELQGVVIILGSGIENSISFDSLKIYDSGFGATLNVKGDLNVVSGGEEIARINNKTLYINGISSADSRSGSEYSISDESGGYKLNIDLAYIREDLSYPYKIIPTRIFNKENVIKSIENYYGEENESEESSDFGSNENFEMESSTSSDNIDLLYEVKLKYENKYLAGDTIRFYIEVFYEYGKIFYPINFDIIKVNQLNNSVIGYLVYDELIIEEEEEVSDGVTETVQHSLVSDETIKNLKNLLSLLLISAGKNNSELIIGKLDFEKYKSEVENGIISKQNVLYSAQFKTDKEETEEITTHTEFPHYDELLTKKLEKEFGSDIESEIEDSSDAFSDEDESSSGDYISCIEAINTATNYIHAGETTSEVTVIGFIRGTAFSSLAYDVNTLSNYKTTSYLIADDEINNDVQLLNVYNTARDTVFVNSDFINTSRGLYKLKVTGQLYKDNGGHIKLINITKVLLENKTNSESNAYYNSYGTYNLKSNEYDNVLVPYRLFRALKSDMDKLKWKLDHTEVVYRSVLRDLMDALFNN